MEEKKTEDFPAEEEDYDSELVATLSEILEQQDTLLRMFRTGLLCLIATCAGLLLAAMVVMVLP